MKFMPTLALALIVSFAGALNAWSQENTEDASRFPRQIRMTGGVATIHEPQIESHEGYRSLTFWSALSYKTYDGEVDIVGAIKAKAEVTTDFESRIVTVYDREILEGYFPELEAADSEAFIKEIQSNFKIEPEQFPLDVMLAYLADGEAPTGSVAVSMDPPEIFYSSTPAMLVLIDGEPAALPLSEDSDLQLVVNATWDLFQSKKTGAYYLLMGKHWLKSKKLEGPWKPAGKLPKSFQKLPEDKRFEKARNAVPGDWIGKKEVPEIFVSTKPAELIVTDGDPTLDPINASPLSFVSNTTNDIIHDSDTSQYYFLTSGRWFAAESLSGPWSAAGELPEAFQKIPEDHERAHVRASIPSTIEAKFAVLEAQVPKTAVVERDLAASETQYFGEAKFDPIEQTGVSRAANTDKDIFLVSGKYYLCEKAVWFVSDNPDGPWEVTDAVPDEIYTIPPSSPSYHVTYVDVDDSTDAHVHFSYTSGYHHSYVSYGTVVYGTGFYWGWGWSYYDPFYYDPFYPYPYWGYYPHYPATYGHASFYNPRNGTYGHGHYAYGPYGGVWAGERYNPRSGRYSQGEYAWDYNTSLYSGRSYNPRTNIATSTNQAFEYYGNNEYESWGESKVQRGNDWITSERYSNQDGSRYRFESSKGGQGGRIVTDDRKGGIYRSGDGDLYASKNGSVYRRNEDGTWQKRSKGNWDAVDFANRERSFDRDSVSLSDSQKQDLRNRASMAERPKVDRSQLENRSGELRKQRNATQYREAREFRQLRHDSFNRNYGNQRFNNYQRSGGRNFGAGRGGRISGSGFRR